MLRRLLFAVLLSVFTAHLYAACDLSMVVSCQTGVNGAPSSCTATTTNNASSACSGLIYSAWFSEETPETVQLSAPENSLQLDTCMDSEEFGQFVDTAISFCFGESSIGAHQSFTSTVHVGGASPRVPLVAVTWVGSEEGDEFGSVHAFTNVDAPTCTPSISAPPVTQSGVEYTVSWTAVSNPSQFIVEESTNADFSSNVTQSQVQGLSKTYRHDNLATATTYYYRVRATNCGNGTPPFSRTAQTVVQAVPPRSTRSAEAAVPFGSTTPVQFKVFVPGGATPMQFTASIDKEYLSVTPSSGTLPPAGIELTVTARPNALPAGANTGALHVVLSELPDSRRISPNAGTTLNIPISISLVTPVAPGSKTLPPPNALVIPVVTHVNVATGQFLSDVRLTNAGASPVNYQVTMTPTQTDATLSSKVTQITVDGQSTIALNDVVKNFFGYGATGTPQDIGFGSLEIRPLNTSSLLTYASSRTYASTPTGTFGQYIAAMPFTRFATQRLSGIPIPGETTTPSTVLSLQHVAQSSRFRTNLGIVEGAGEPALGRIRVFDTIGFLRKEVPFSLLPGEHRQMNRFIEVDAGIPTLEDGRIEIVIDSPTGAVTAYASVLDSVTTDPLAVMPVDPTKVSATRYVIPGIADIPAGQQNFHSDLRLFNGGEFASPITLTFYPGNGFAGFGTPVTAEPRTINAGEILVLDNVLPALFGKTSTGGSIVVTTPSNSSLVATARTYTAVENNGSYGQFIPGITPAEGIGAGDRALQILQLEESDQFRSNVGLSELTGNGATVRLTLQLPDTKVTASTEVTLAPNEFRQLRPIVGLNPGKQTYNARLTVEVIGGTGRVTAYGSVIDNESKDPTYVPAQ